MKIFYVVASVSGIVILLEVVALALGQQASPERLRIASMAGSMIDRTYSVSLVDVHTGIRLERTLSPQLAGEWRWSPDRQHIAYESIWAKQDGASEIFAANIDGTDLHNMSNHPANDTTPVWSPDGNTIAFVSDRDGNNNIYLVNPHGNSLRQLTTHEAQDNTPVWSPDGRHIAFMSWRDGNAEIYVIDADGSNLRNLSHHPAYDQSPVWSPDGRMIAFESQRNGQHEIYVVNIDTLSARNLSGSSGTVLSFIWDTDGDKSRQRAKEVHDA